MRVLIACEFSGRVREAFRVLGHDAWSCDLLPTEIEGQHIQKDVLEVLDDGWDLMIAHPPCTHLSSSGARWFKDKTNEQKQAIEFVEALMAASINRIAIENPIGILSKVLWAPDQIIQPYNFGDNESKATCLWLWNLPLLHVTHRPSMLDIKTSIHHEPPGPERWKNRSRTFQGIATAMANQWSQLQLEAVA